MKFRARGDVESIRGVNVRGDAFIYQVQLQRKQVGNLKVLQQNVWRKISICWQKWVYTVSLKVHECSSFRFGYWIPFYVARWTLRCCPYDKGHVPENMCMVIDYPLLFHDMNFSFRGLKNEEVARSCAKNIIPDMNIYIWRYIIPRRSCFLCTAVPFMFCW